MKKIIILLIALATSTLAIGQEEKTEQIKEVGLTFRNLDNFGFSYKVGTEQALWRFNALSFSGGTGSSDNSNTNYDQDSNALGFSFSVGKEYRKLLAKNMEFRYGADLSFAYSYMKGSLDSKSETGYDTEERNNQYTPGINMVLGVNYIINDHIILGAEIMPHIGYSFSKNTRKVDDIEESTEENSNFSYGLNSSSVLLSLAYRF